MTLPRRFYERDTSKVARDLLGKLLLRSSQGSRTGGKIVETEAYYGRGDPASRASDKRTKVNEIMWDRGGLALVYMVHGHWLFNITTEGEGTPGAVLIRALEPMEGLGTMKERRNKKGVRELTSGPGKLTEALGISKRHHGSDLSVGGEISISETDKEEDLEIETSHRVGVGEDLERELRFYVAYNEHVSHQSAA